MCFPLVQGPDAVRLVGLSLTRTVCGAWQVEKSAFSPIISNSCGAFGGQNTAMEPEIASGGLIQHHKSRRSQATSKYDPLIRHLSNHHSGDALTLAFEEIEALLWESLPTTARSHLAWPGSAICCSAFHSQQGERQDEDLYQFPDPRIRAIPRRGTICRDNAASRAGHGGGFRRTAELASNRMPSGGAISRPGSPDPRRALRIGTRDLRRLANA